MESKENAQTWIQSTIASGNVDAATVILMDSAMAYAGRDYANAIKNGTIKEGEITGTPGEQKDQFDALKKIAHDSLQESPFREAAGTAGILDKYIDNLIGRSEKLDAQQGKPQGTNLKAFLNRSAKAVDGVDFDAVEKAVKNNDMGYLLDLKSKFEGEQGIQKQINAAAADHIDPALKGVKSQDDLLKTLKEDEKDKKTFREAAIDEPKPRGFGGGLMQIILLFIGMLLGLDMSGFMGASQKPGTQEKRGQGTPSQEQIAQTLNANHISMLSPEMEKKLETLIPAAQHLKDGKADKKDLKEVADFSGISEEALNKFSPDQQKTVGSQVLNGVTKLRTGELKTEQAVKTDIQKSTADVAMQPFKDLANGAVNLAGYIAKAAPAIPSPYEKIFAITQQAVAAAVTPAMQQIKKTER